MDHASLERFFMFGTIIGGVLLAITVIAWPLARGFAHRVHGRIFGVTPQVIDITVYACLGLMKLFIGCLFLLPWIALLLTRPDGDG